MNKEKNFVIIRLVLSILLGITFVMLLNSPIKGNSNSYISREIASQINQEKSLLQKNEKKIDDLNKEYRNLQKKAVDGTKLLSKQEEEQMQKLRMLLGQENIHGEGVIINLEAVDPNQNIAFSVDSNRLLLKVSNLAKRKGGEFVAINNQLITNSTGIVLAGNHININNVPITPPYEVKVIGNEKYLYRYFTEESIFLMAVQKNYNIKTEVTKSKKINIPKNHLLKEIEYIKESK